MRTIIRLTSINLGLFVLVVTFNGDIEYRGVDNPIVNIVIAGALIFAPTEAAIYLGVYLILVGTLIVGSLIGAIIGSKMFGPYGTILGGIVGTIVGGWIGTKLELAGMIQKIRGKLDDY